MSFYFNGQDISANLWFVALPMIAAWAAIIVASVRIVSENRNEFALGKILPLAGSAALTLAIMAAYSGFASEYWNPGEQNWKFEYNGIMLSRGESPFFMHSSPQGSSLLMIPFFLLFGETHLAVVIMNGLALLCTAIFVSLAAREVFGRYTLPTLLAGPLMIAYFPIIALWGAGGEYALFLATMSGSTWLMLRSMRDNSPASLILTGACLFMSALIRTEGFFLWLLWPFMLLLSDGINLKKFMLICGGAFISLALILINIRHIIFGNAGKPILRLEHLQNNSSWLAFFLSDGALVLLLLLPGLVALTRRNPTAAISLLCLSAGYALFWLLGPSYDHHQISTQIFMPLCVVASGAFELFPGRLKNMKFIVALSILLVHALPLGTTEHYLSGKIKEGAGSDFEIRTLSSELQKDVPVLGNLPHIKMTMPSLIPLADRDVTIGELEQIIAAHNRFACFSSIEHPNECAYTRELFPGKGAARLFEPEQLGFELNERRQLGKSFLNIYSRKEDG